MKNFKKFLEEVTIKGNPGVPDGYLPNIEQRAKQELGLTGRETPHQIGPRMMQLLFKATSLTNGKEKELEDLAKEIIFSNFGDIIEGVELDIKLVKPGSSEISDLMDSESESESEIELPLMKKINDPELIAKIHKAKLGNVIIQGEAKNTKNIIHSEEVKNGIYKIFDRRKADELLEAWKEISTLAHKMDWIIPIDIKADMMENAPDGMAGAVKVEWNKKESEDEEEPTYVDDILDKISRSEELGTDDLEFLSDQVEQYDPKIIARGVDFPMLIHETVKGIFELIAAVSLPDQDADPEEIKKAEIVKYNVSSFEDEAEDFRTGPEIASDFRDFINENKHSNNYPNLRAYVFGYMMDSNKLSDTEFLELFKGVLNKTSEARQKIDDIIDEIVEQLNEYELDVAFQGDIIPNEGETEVDAIVRKSEEEKEDKDYAKMSQREIQNLIDNALDNGDYEEVRLLSQFLKEGKEIYLKEIKKILES